MHTMTTRPRQHRTIYSGVVGISLLGLVTSGLMMAPSAHATSDSFTATGPMATARENATAALTSRGTVIVAGGSADILALNTTSIYNPATGTFSNGPTLSSTRNGAGSASLDNGLVLIAGGNDAGTADLYNPDTNLISAAGDMAAAVYTPAVAKLNDGRVLVTGGYARVTAQTYSQTYRSADGPGGAFTSNSPMAVGRLYATATALPNGNALVAGGSNFSGSETTESAEIFSPTSSMYTSTGSMAAPRYGATATLLANGKVLIAGGRNASGILNGTEIYDPNVGTFSSGPSMAAGRSSATATLLIDGRVLVVGGMNLSEVLGSSEIYDPATNSFTTGPTLATARTGATATRLTNGQVLLAGGTGASFSGLSSAELFTPKTTNPGAAQTLVNCSALPRKVKRSGTAVVLKRRCMTSSGQSLKVGVKRIGKAKKTAKITKSRSGKITIKTRNSRGLKLVVTRSAPASTGFLAYKQVKTYKIK